METKDSSEEETDVEVAEPDELHSSSVSSYTNKIPALEPCNQSVRREEISIHNPTNGRVTRTSLRQPDDDAVVVPKVRAKPTAASHSFLDQKIVNANRRSKEDCQCQP